MNESLFEYLSLKNSLEETTRLKNVSYEELAQLQYLYAVKKDTLLIENIPGYRYSFLTNLMADRNSLVELLNSDLENHHNRFIQCMENPVKPKTVTSAACQEVVYRDDEIDLMALPAVQFSQNDVGRYITAGIAMARDPENLRNRNASIHRMQIRDKKTLGIRLEGASHLLVMQKKAEEMNQPLPVALVIGTHPAELISSVTSLEYGEDEMGLAGAIRGEPVEMVKCMTIDVEVPATAQIVIEGFIPPGIKETEGPFGDFQGYYVTPQPNHIIEVTAITCVGERPIYQSIRAGSHEDALLLGFTREIGIKKALTANNHRVKGVSVSPMVFNCAIAIDKQSDDEVREILDLAFSDYSWVKYCVVMDSDVDCYDLQDVWWAMATRSNPKDAYIVESAPGFGRDPFGLHTGKMGIDATMPVAHQEAFTRAKPKF